MLRFWQFSVVAQAVQSFQIVDAMRSFLHVNGSKSAIRCILGQSGSRLLSFSVHLKSEKLTA